VKQDVFDKHFRLTHGGATTVCRSCGVDVVDTDVHLAWHYALDDRLKGIASDASWGTLLRPIGGRLQSDAASAADRIIAAVWPERESPADESSRDGGSA
jgi:hypothetical protein